MSERQKFFTVEEANALIPKLSAIVERVGTLKREISSSASQLGSVLEKATTNGGHGDGANYISKLTEFQNCISAITEIGCLLKDVDLGLVDFPSIRDGRKIYLCWRLGEDTVEFWHELDTGYTGRKPI